MFKSKQVVIIVSAVLVIFVLIVGIGLITGYNGLVNLDEDINLKYSQIEVRLEERHDKIGQIVASVSGLQDHELAVYQAIVDARTAYANANTQDELIAADALEAVALANLLVVMENYPTIAAAGSYYLLIDEISSMESSLAVARRDFNEAVQDYNASVRRFPRVLYAGLFGFDKSVEYWKMNDGADEVPVIEFD